MQVLHMNKGEGENSYTKNSNIQKQIITVAGSILEEAAANSLLKTLPESMGIADLGCSTGPNSLMVISTIIDTIIATSDQMGISSKILPDELRISLNDLPGNDFNSIFVSLPEFYRKLQQKRENFCFISGVAGSFYGRLFPKKSLHFVHSSSSLHWLSQVPPGLEKNSSEHLNKGEIYISKTSPACVFKAYHFQFQRDFVEFLSSRADEMVGGGGMLLSFIGRSSADASNEKEISCKQWALLAQALMSMVPQGLVEEEKIDSFNAPYYAPSAEEVRYAIQQEGSFIINHLEAFEIDWDGGSVSDNACEKFKKLSRGERVAKTIRAVLEPMLESHFGIKIMDELFVRYGKLVDDYLLKTRAKLINLVISLTRDT